MNFGVIFSSIQIFLVTYMACVAFADTLVSNNGDKLIGTLLGFDREACTYLLSIDNQQITVPWKKIKTMKTESFYKVRLAGGDQITGIIEYSSRKGLKLLSNSSQSYINLSLLENVQPAQPLTPSNDQRTVEPTSQSVQVASADLAPQKSSDSNENVSKPTFGVEEETAPTTFLRGTSVLLDPGQVEGRLTFAYTPKKREYYGTSRQRLFYSVLGLNVGIHDRAEGWVNLPIGYVLAYENSIFQPETRQSKLGLMDISFGLTGLLWTETDDRPEATISLSASAPTGEEPYDVDKIYSLGTGHWSMGAGLNFVKSVDPAIMFGGISGTHYWPHRQYGQVFAYDELAWNYYWGVGFAINERLSMSTRLNGAYQPALKADGVQANLSTDPMWATFSFGYMMDSHLVLEPQFSFGLNGDAGDPQISLAISKKFF
jgi:hypothetical protein